MSISSQHITRYLEMVENGEIVACKEQHLLCAHVRKCFDEEDLIIAHEKLEKYLSYQKYFPYDLFEWEVFVFALHCCVFRKDGFPRWPDLLLELGRGSGKNGYEAFEDFCLLTKTHGIQEYDIDLCATTEYQARRTFDDLLKVLDDPDNKILGKVFRWNLTMITNTQTNSTLRYHTNNARSKDGLRSGKVGFDEVHEYDDYDNIRVFTGALGKKPHPRRSYATSNGYIRDGVLDDLNRRAADILEGKLPDGGLLPFICKLDAREEVDDEAMWHKANPSLRYLPNLLEELCKQYQDMSMAASLKSDFLTKRMNLYEGDKELEVTSWENILACSTPIPDLTGKTGVVGIDFAKVTDFASIGILIPVGDMHYWISHSWLCAASKDIPRMKCPWREWADAGFLTVVEDVEIDPALLVNWMVLQAERFDLRGLAMDSFRYALIKKELERAGFVAKRDQKSSGDKIVKLVRPNDIMIVSPIIERKFALHQFCYGDNPVMRWAINNTKMHRGGINKDTGNMTYAKIEPKSRKNDPFMALVAAETIVEEIQFPDIGAFPAIDVHVYN